MVTASRFGTARAKKVFAGIALVALLAAGLTGSTAAATPSLALTVQLVPGVVSPGKPELAIATFRNLSPVALPGVVVTVHLPRGFTVVSPGTCLIAKKSAGTIACPLGEVAAHSTITASVISRAPKTISEETSVKATFALRVGSSKPNPILTGTSAKVLASNNNAEKGSCSVKPAPITATLNNQQTELVAPTAAAAALHLLCTPLTVGVEAKPASGVYKTQISSVGLPQLKHPTVVKLTFPNETLPDERWIDDIVPGTKPAFDNANPLWMFDAKAPGGKRVVPKCTAAHTFPAGWLTCVLQVHAIDVPSQNGLTDEADDYDKGWIKLLVQGTGFGDPRYIG
jgi:hypothetical protein